MGVGAVLARPAWPQHYYHMTLAYNGTIAGAYRGN